MKNAWLVLEDGGVFPGESTGLNLAFFLMKEGILKKYGVESIGASVDAISRAEDRELFKKAMKVSVLLRPPDLVLVATVKIRLAMRC